jgi:hypothetical protein
MPRIPLSPAGAGLVALPWFLAYLMLIFEH